MNKPHVFARPCEACEYFRPSERNVGQGECFHSPPTAVPAQGLGGQVGVISIRPVVDRDHTCHHHTARLTS